jgi:ABC-2 type transport system permease protein
MAVSAVVHRRVLAVALPGAVLVAMYFANALGNLVEELEDLQPLTIFYHYGSAIEDGIDWPSFAGVGAAALLLLLLAVVLFRRRDVYA